MGGSSAGHVSRNAQQSVETAARATPTGTGQMVQSWALRLQRSAGNRAVTWLLHAKHADLGGLQGMLDHTPARILQRCAETGKPDCACDVHPATPHLPVSRPDDPLEREAERTARSVLAGPAAPVSTTIRAGAPTVARMAQDAPLRGLPPRAGLAGLGSGRPLPLAERAVFETRLGRDLSAVRVHSDQAAAELAGRMHARALTVGTDIAFAAGAFRPGSTDGRMLLAHELAHVLQQTVGLGQAPPVPAMLQRLCQPTACPLVSVPVTALNPIWKQAEICVQEAYAATHPASRRGVSLGFNLDWIHLTGRTPAEQEALACLRGNFTAKSGMFAGEPDIWDFANTTMYEITTPSGAAFRVGKLAAEIALANKLTAPMECGGLYFSPGSWVPPGPCYPIGGDLYISVFNTGGVLVYQVLKDASKEATLALLLALLAAAAKKGGGAASGKAVGARAGGRAVPAYRVAALVAAVILVGSGRARAEIGPGTEEPIAQLFQALAASGTPAPPEIQEMIESDPALKAKIEKALREGGDPSAVQKELNEEILAIIAANRDQFSEADLEVLLATTGAAGGQLPKGKQTVDTLRKLLDEQRKGAAGGGGKGGAKAPGPKAPQRPAEQPGARPPEPGREAAPGQAAGPAISPEVSKRLAAASAPARRLWDAVVGPGEGPAVTDDNARRFLAEIPKDLSDEQVSTLITLLGPVKDRSFDDILAQLKQAIAELRKPAGAADKQGNASSQSKAMDGGATAPSATDDTDLIRQLAAEAAKIDVKKHRRGEFLLTWEEEKDNVIEGAVRGVTGDGRPAAGTVRARIDERSGDGKRLRVTYLAASPLVDSRGRIVRAAGELVGTKDTLDVIVKRR